MKKRPGVGGPPGGVGGGPRAFSGSWRRESVVVDDWLGHRDHGKAPRPPLPAAIRLANEAGGGVVALDAPSGVDGNTGGVPGDAVRADITVSFGWPKLGTLLYPGREWCGRVVAVEIGFPPPEADDWARLVTPGWAREALPRRPSVTHKYDVGALAIVAGRPPGAAPFHPGRVPCGVGLVRVCASARPRRVLGEFRRRLRGSLTRRVAQCRGTERRAAPSGPGLARGVGAAPVEVAPGGARIAPAVIDADALTLWRGGTRPRGASGANSRARLTPARWPA